MQINILLVIKVEENNLKDNLSLHIFLLKTVQCNIIDPLKARL